MTCTLRSRRPPKSSIPRASSGTTLSASFHPWHRGACTSRRRARSASREASPSTMIARNSSGSGRHCVRRTAPSGTVLVIGGGWVQIRKGVDLFIAVAAAVLRAQSATRFHFVWVGGGYDPITDHAYSTYLAEQIEKSELGRELRHAGRGLAPRPRVRRSGYFSSERPSRSVPERRHRRHAARDAARVLRGGVRGRRGAGRAARLSRARGPARSRSISRPRASWNWARTRRIAGRCLPASRRSPRTPSTWIPIRTGSIEFGRERRRHQASAIGGRCHDRRRLLVRCRVLQLCGRPAPTEGCGHSDIRTSLRQRHARPETLPRVSSGHLRRAAPGADEAALRQSVRALHPRAQAAGRLVHSIDQAGKPGCTAKRRAAQGGGPPSSLLPRAGGRVHPSPVGQPSDLRPLPVDVEGRACADDREHARLIPCGSSRDPGRAQCRS